MNERCATCRYHQLEPITLGYVCVNGDSKYVTEWTDEDFCCSEWEVQDADKA